MDGLTNQAGFGAKLLCGPSAEDSVSPLASIVADLEARWSAEHPAVSWPRVRGEGEFWTLVGAERDLFTCWPWLGPLDRHGYGIVLYRHRTWRAHRLAYTLARGVIADGLTLDHVCHNIDRSCHGGPGCAHRACVNPAHLDPCTQWENVQRGFWGMKP